MILFNWLPERKIYSEHSEHFIFFSAAPNDLFDHLFYSPPPPASEITKRNKLSISKQFPNVLTKLSKDTTNHSHRVFQIHTAAAAADAVKIKRGKNFQSLSEYICRRSKCRVACDHTVVEGFDWARQPPPPPFN